ncbi:hypothetical protein ACK6VY_15435 [Proteus mirabilis]|uniref:hypothetical protein n=1 Tax=Proteus mirabilis TaxID=584 RepID=UPI0039B5FAB5
MYTYLKNKFKLISVIIFMILSAILLISSKENKRNEINYCVGDINTNNVNLKSQGTMRYEFNKGIGVIIYNGIVYDNKNINNFSYKVYFSYTKHNNTYIMKSKKIIDIGDNNETKLPSEYRNTLPHFYKHENETYILGIYKVSSNGYLFYNFFVPFLYCEHK